MATTAFMQRANPERMQERKDIIERLDAYIARIEGPKIKNANGKEQIDFKHRFWLFAHSQGVNRMANYKLAQTLKQKIEANPTASIQALLKNEDMLALRRDNMNPEKFPRVDHGINSSELKGILDTINPDWKANSVSDDDIASYGT